MRTSIMRQLALIPALAVLVLSGCNDAAAPRAQAAPSPAPKAETKPAAATEPVAALASTPAPAPVQAKAAEPAAAPVAELQPGLVAEYFSLEPGPVEDFPNLAAGTKPAVKRVDGTVNFETTDEAWPGTQLVDHFYIRWTGLVHIAKDGKYTFSCESDDGSRLFIDDKQVLDNNGQHAMEEKSGEVELKAGDHPLKLEFWENEGGAGCKLSWAGEGIDKAIVPAAALFHKAGAEK
jgi:hypothetical protein